MHILGWIGPYEIKGVFRDDEEFLLYDEGELRPPKVPILVGRLAAAFATKLESVGAADRKAVCWAFEMIGRAGVPWLARVTCSKNSEAAHSAFVILAEWEVVELKACEGDDIGIRESGPAPSGRRRARDGSVLSSRMHQPCRSQLFLEWRRRAFEHVLSGLRSERKAEQDFAFTFLAEKGGITAEEASQIGDAFSSLVLLVRERLYEVLDESDSGDLRHATLLEIIEKIEAKTKRGRRGGT